MKELGLEGATLEVVEDIYTHSTTQVRIGKEQIDSIPCEKGMKQGCLLSVILFDLVLEQLVKGFNSDGYDFINGEIAIAETPEWLQEMLDCAQQFVGWVGLQFKASKCVH